MNRIYMSIHFQYTVYKLQKYYPYEYHDRRRNEYNNHKSQYVNAITQVCLHDCVNAITQVCLHDCVNADEKRIEERYDSIKAAVYLNPGYNYASLRNAISKGIKYKGYYWEWADVDLDAHDQLYLMIKRHEEIQYQN